jgi:tetratricopeptide (TPR) repeat protein
MEYYRKKNSHKALMLFKECLKYDSENIDCLYFMGSCCLNLQNYEQSIKYLSHAKNLNPSYNQTLYLYLAICFKMLKKEDEAIKILQIGVKKFPDFEEGYLYIGNSMVY